MEKEDETKACLLWLMCDKCSRLGEFSRSLEQVIMQELLLAWPRPALYWFTETHATNGMHFPLNRFAKPANTLTYTPCYMSHGAHRHLAAASQPYIILQDYMWSLWM